MATQPVYLLLTAEEFFEIDFGHRKAELDNGVIRMMAGGSSRHAQLQSNINFVLRARLRGSGRFAYGPDMAVQSSDRSIRYPDASVYCGRGKAADDNLNAFDDPRVVFEVLSAGTARTDLRAKLGDYKELASVDTIVFVDIATERLRVIQRTGPTAWTDVAHTEPFDLPLPSLAITLPHAELFARD